MDTWKRSWLWEIAGERGGGQKAFTCRVVRGLVGRCLSLNRKQVLGLAFLMRKRSGEEGKERCVER